MELFTNLLNKGIESLLSYVENKMENEFKGMLSMNWEKLENVGDSSNYVKMWKNILDKHVERIFNLISFILFLL